MTNGSHPHPAEKPMPTSKPGPSKPDTKGEKPSPKK